MSGVLSKNSRGNSRHVSTLLARHADIQIPEQKLMLAILIKAISDLMDKTPSNRYYRAAAGDFFTREEHVYFCDMCGINPDWVLELLRDHAGLDIGR